MSLARRAARAALAASFISGGIDQIRNPQPKAAPASPIAKPIADRVPQLPNDPESLVKLDGAIKVVGGLGLVFGPFARPAALLLAASMVPTTLAGHRFWETTDPEQKASDKVEFFKNVSLVGGLLITALDTGGRPSIPWVANKAAHGAAEAVGEAAESVGEVLSGAAGTVGGTVGGAAAAVGGAVSAGAGKVGGGSPSLSRRTRKAVAKAEKRSAALFTAAEAQSLRALALAERKSAALAAAGKEGGGKGLARADKQSGRALRRGRNRNSAQETAVAALGTAAAAAGKALASAQDSAQELTGRARRKANKASAKAAKRADRAAGKAQKKLRKQADAVQEGVVAAKDKLAAAVSH